LCCTQSADAPTTPRDTIRRITSSFPNDPRSPFYDPTGEEMKPLARLYLTRQRLYEKSCADEGQNSYEDIDVNSSEMGTLINIYIYFQTHKGIAKGGVFGV
jgi:hypothetical protein